MNEWREEILNNLVVVDPEQLSSSTDEKFTFFYIDISSVNNGHIDYPASQIKFKGSPSRARKNLKLNDVLMSTVRPNLKSFAKFNRESKFNFVASTGFAILRAKQETDIDFIYHNLFSEKIERQIQALVVGSNYPAINSSDVRQLIFDVPGFQTQRKIARILSTADAVIEKTKAAIAKYKAIKQGMLHDLFTRGIDPPTGKLRPTYENAPELYKPSKLGMVPQDWEEKKIEDIAKVNGRVGWKGYTVSDLREIGPLAIGAAHIDKDNKLDLTNPIYLSFEKYFESPEIMVQFGDILIVQRGTIGKIVIIDREIGEATINPSMILLNNIKLNKFFLFYQLISFIGQRQIESLTSQTGVPMISQEQINNIVLIKPCNNVETNKISERLKSIDNKIQTEQTYLKKLQQIKTGLMADLLTGKKKVRIA